MLRGFRSVIVVVSFFALVFGILPQYNAIAATSYNVASYSDFTTALTAATDGDIINVTRDITITAALTVSKALTINGNGFTVTVPVPGLDSSGIYNSSPSTFRVFNANASGKTIIINDIIVKGGRAGRCFGRRYFE